MSKENEDWRIEAVARMGFIKSLRRNKQMKIMDAERKIKHYEEDIRMLNDYYERDELLLNGE